MTEHAVNVSTTGDNRLKPDIRHNGNERFGQRLSFEGTFVRAKSNVTSFFTLAWWPAYSFVNVRILTRGRARG